MATCSAVRALSPVAIITVWLLALSALTTSGVSLRTGHAKARNPSKVKPLSISSRVKGAFWSRSLALSASVRTRWASAMMRMPSSASLR